MNQPLWGKTNWVVWPMYESPAQDLASATRQLEINNKIVSFGDLHRGWHYGQGEQPSKALIKTIRNLHNKAYVLGFAKTDAFPRINGGILLTVYDAGFVIDISAEPNGDDFSISVERDEDEVLEIEGLSLDSVYLWLTGLRKLCRSFDQSTNFTTPRMNVDSRAKHSKHHLTDLEYQLLMQIAQEHMREASVPTLSDITSQKLQVSRQSFGNLLPMLFQKELRGS